MPATLMTFDQPLAFLLLIIFFPLVAYLARRRLRRLPGRRGTIVLSVRCLLLFFIVTALAQPAVLQATRPLKVVFAVDVGAGELPAQRTAVGAWISRAVHDLKPEDTAALLTYASV